MKQCSICVRVVLSVLLGISVFSCGPRMPEIGSGGLSAMGPQSVAGGVKFMFFAPKAHKVMIVGDFNNWSTTADPMYDREEKGLWSITLPLQPGRYEYKFLVDGEKWVGDLANTKKVKDGFGASNSVVEVNP